MWHYSKQAAICPCKPSMLSQRRPWEMAPGRSSTVHNEMAKRNPRPNRGSSTASRLFERNSPPIRTTFCRYRCPCRTFGVIAVVSISMTACQTTSSCARSLILIGPLSVDCLRGEVQWPQELCFLSVRATTHQYFMSASQNEQAYFIRYNEQEISSEGHLFCRSVGPESITKADCFLPLLVSASWLQDTIQLPTVICLYTVSLWTSFGLDRDLTEARITAYVVIASNICRQWNWGLN